MDEGDIPNGNDPNVMTRPLRLWYVKFMPGNSWKMTENIPCRKLVSAEEQSDNDFLVSVRKVKAKYASFFK